MTIHGNFCDSLYPITCYLNRRCTGPIVTLADLFVPKVNMAANSSSAAPVSEIKENLFAKVPYFISDTQFSKMESLILSVEYVVSLPEYQLRALSWAPEISLFKPGPDGVFFSYDFHIAEGNPKLIEVNSNAGGALLSSFLLRTQRSRRSEVPSPLRLLNPNDVELDIIDMFLKEWRLQKGSTPLRSIAIVDIDPSSQFLSSEFELFVELFQKVGIKTVVVDPYDLALINGYLWYDNTKIDMIYNRLTDFALSEPFSQSIRKAYLASKVVVTPNPRSHALYADKRNLTLLSNDGLLRSWGVPQDVRSVLSEAIPRTEIVSKKNSEELWRNRRRLFFKPSSGYGSKAAYRGDKITKRAWSEVLSGSYVAQEIVKPGERSISVDGSVTAFKADLRCYVYDRSVMLTSARLYRGQTTNFRTPEGGFASVFIVNDDFAHSLGSCYRKGRVPDSINPFYVYACGHPVS